MDRTSEKYIERKLVENVRSMGGVCIKLVPQLHGGLPDRICLLPEGKIIFVEVKGKGLKPSKLQKWTIKKLRKLGFKAEVLDDENQIQEILC